MNIIYNEFAHNSLKLTWPHQTQYYNVNPQVIICALETVVCGKHKAFQLHHKRWPLFKGCAPQSLK